MNRSSGVLMHISSLYGDYSVGSFGKEAMEFIDFLSESGFSYWQVLPFCMTDDCNSPYKSFSSFGANPLFIDLPTLKYKGLLTDAELWEAKQKAPYLCEYHRLSSERLPLLRIAAGRVGEDEKKEIADFIKKFPPLAETAEFLALREANVGKEWVDWTVDTPDDDELFFWQFIQHEFFTQWSMIKSYANSKGIKIIGDIPIYVAFDSADVWANPHQFKLDKNRRPSCVAGVPPDYFSEDGQLWGNPLYDWNAMKKDGYSWWSRRIEYMLTLFDGVRIDHFRGFESYWSIPADAKTAKEGKWVKGPGRAIVDKIREIAGDRLIIAEDLGDITPAVNSLLKYSKFPGMRVFQFAFLGDEESPHLPHNYVKNSIAYSGTHDNNTLLGYVWELDPETRARVFEYCNCESDDWNRGCVMIIKTLMASHSDTVIFPIQDIFVYGKDTRMNTPGTSESNWAYRITRDQLFAVDRKKFHRLNRLYGRTEN
ncbi:MAG: 4-alpha-glucanotransferase [Ruminococcaceae bacterium]|nr:4-alpha-glucanotransferase [Oscillospiraceae bacterium]